MTAVNPVGPREGDDTNPPQRTPSRGDDEGTEVAEDDRDDSIYAATEPDDRKPQEGAMDEDLFANRDDNMGMDDELKDVVKGAKVQDPFKCVECVATDGRVPKRLNAPIRPSAKDIACHNITHLPYRSWCSVCVRAKGREDAHRRSKKSGKDENKDGLPIISLDYQHLDESEDLKKIKVIIGKDETSGSIMAHVIKVKGPTDEWVCKKLVKDFEEFGRRDVMLKTDGESSTVAVQAKIQSLRLGRTVPRNPPVYDPKANGPCEKAVQDLSAHTRALKLALESRIKAEIKEGDAIIDWMVPHAAYLLNKFSVGHDGMAPHERLTGHKWKRAMVEIGEIVHAKLASQRQFHGKRKKQKKKLAERMISAVWVGQVARSGEHVVIKQSGDAVRCRTIKRVPQEERWSADRIFAIKGTPRLPAPSRKDPEKLEGILVDEEAALSPQQARQPRAREEAPRRGTGADLEPPEARFSDDVRDLRISDRVLAKYGFTQSCDGCEWKQHKSPGSSRKPHSTECRRRIQEAMEKDEIDKFTVEQSKQRMLRKADQLHLHERGEEGEARASRDRNPVEAAAAAAAECLHGGGYGRC